MSDKKRGFVVYFDLADSLAAFSDAEVGRIFRAMLAYAENGEELPLPDREAIAFGFIKTLIDRDGERYADTCAKRKAAIEARWERERGENTKNTKDTNEYKSIQKIQKYTNDTDTDIEKGRDKEKEKEKEIIIPPLPPTGGTARGNAFETFWKAYPKKVGRAACEKEWTRRCYTSEDADEMVKALERQKRTDQWKRGYIPNPLKWLKEERWNDTEAQPNGPTYEITESASVRQRVIQFQKEAAK